MNHRFADELLWRYVDGLRHGWEDVDRCLSLFPAHRPQLEPILLLAQRLSLSLTPVRPSPDFALRLKHELLKAAAERPVGPARSAAHRDLWWHAAAVGSAVSVAAAVALMWRSHAQSGRRQPVA
jgi:hypothetical protein